MGGRGASSASSVVAKKAANAAFSSFLDYYYLHNKDSWFPDDRKGKR